MPPGPVWIGYEKSKLHEYFEMEPCFFLTSIKIRRTTNRTVNPKKLKQLKEIICLVEEGKHCETKNMWHCQNLLSNRHLSKPPVSAFPLGFLEEPQQELYNLQGMIYTCIASSEGMTPRLTEACNGFLWWRMGGWDPQAFYPNANTVDRGMVAMAAEYLVKFRHNTHSPEC